MGLGGCLLMRVGMLGPTANILAKIGGIYTGGGYDGALTFSTCSNTSQGVNPPERMRITSGGNVGIGTTAPAELLELSATTDPKIQFTDVGNVISKIGISASTALTFEHNGAERLRIDASGRVGIGTTSPLSVLDVQTNAVERRSIRFSGTGLSNAEIHCTESGGYNRDLTFGASTLAFYIGSAGSTSRAEAARIDSSSRLLVGTSTARANFNNSTESAALQLEGTAANRRLSITGADNAAVTILARQRSGAVGGNTIVQDSDAIGVIRFEGSDGSQFVQAAGIQCEVDGTPGANDMPGRLVFSTTADGSASPTERMRITSDAYVRLASGTGGIQFNGDTAAANALDDYEEGTFTPVLNGVGSTGTGTYTLQQGRYTKIGRTVSIDIVLTWTAHTGTGTMYITGIPFTFGIGFGYRAPLSINTTGVSATVAYGDGAYGNISVPTTIASSGTIYINGTYTI
jgi:hypothetical protein